MISSFVAGKAACDDRVEANLGGTNGRRVGESRTVSDSTFGPGCFLLGLRASLPCLPGLLAGLPLLSCAAFCYLSKLVPGVLLGLVGLPVSLLSDSFFGSAASFWPERPPPSRTLPIRFW